jgi:hypothetical protein
MYSFYTWNFLTNFYAENNEVAFGGMANYMNPPQFANGGWPGVVMASRGGDGNAKVHLLSPL